MRSHQGGPIRAADTPPAPPAPEPETRPLGRLLIAASDPDLRLYVRLGLDDLAIRVLEAADGLEALRRFDGRRADLVVADARMPGLGGVQLARELAARRASLLLLDDGAERSGSAGVTAVLVKPFDRRQLRLAALAAAGAGSRESVR